MKSDVQTHTKAKKKRKTFMSCIKHDTYLYTADFFVAQTKSILFDVYEMWIKLYRQMIHSPSK